MAQQDAERAKFIVEKAEQDKQSSIIRAQGEAASATLLGQAIQQNPAFITLRWAWVSVCVWGEGGTRGVRACVCNQLPPTDPPRPSPPKTESRKIEAAREIAGTVSASANRVFLSADSLLLNLGELDAGLHKRK